MEFGRLLMLPILMIMLVLTDCLVLSRCRELLYLPLFLNGCLVLFSYVVLLRVLWFSLYRNLCLIRCKKGR